MDEFQKGMQTANSVELNSAIYALALIEADMGRDGEGGSVLRMDLQPDGGPIGVDWDRETNGSRVRQDWLNGWLKASEREMGGGDLRHLSSSLWALGKLELRPPRLWILSWLAEFQRKVQEGTPHELGIAIYSLAMLDERPGDQWMRTWLGAFLGRMGEADARSLANAAWGLSRLKCFPPRQWMEEWQVAYEEDRPNAMPKTERQVEHAFKMWDKPLPWHR